jgi:porphobilinogen synthase
VQELFRNSCGQHLRKVDENLKDNAGKLEPKRTHANAIRAIKAACPEMIVMPDVAFDPYSIYGHDGIIANGDGK